MQGTGALGPLVFGFTVRWGWTLLHTVGCISPGGMHLRGWKKILERLWLLL